MKDKIVEAVREDLKTRSEEGIKKYGTTMDREDLTLKDWLIHAYEETLDKALYLKKAITMLDEDYNKKVSNSCCKNKQQDCCKQNAED